MMVRPNRTKLEGYMWSLDAPAAEDNPRCLQDSNTSWLGFESRLGYML
jgi:hypothetical protein